ncbi:MAG: hypothetical protein J6Z82_04450 [Schwartzia sp.]|nr:hypothetical protein [Schwartzia sp. (in: firmicutes)]
MEILGFLIIVGLLIVFIVRRDLWSGSSSGNKADEVEEASVKMRLQMEHTMNTLITQMDARIHQIEGLVSAADERARTLEKQLAAVREEQASARRKAEQEIAAMRAAQNSYYPARENPYMPNYSAAGGAPSSWRELANYRAQRIPSRPSMQPVGGVSSVHRADYAAGAGLDRPEEGGGFAEALSASMQAAERNYGVPRPVHYREAAYEDRGYEDVYERAVYPAEPYAPADEWSRQEAMPRREAPVIRWPEATPAEIVAEETPAAIVEPRMGERSELRIEEETEDEGPIFTPEQLEELAKTEAEVVVSSSVADVVDLPVHPDEEDNASYYDETESDEDEQTVAAEDETEEEASYWAQEGEEELSETDEPAGFLETEDESAQETENGEENPEATEETIAASETKGEAAEQDESDDFEEEPEEKPGSLYDDGEALSAALSGEVFEDEDEEQRTETPPMTMRPDSPAFRARELLEKGMPPEEVTRETGMGRGAIDLLAQMVKSQRKTESGD